MDVLPTILRVVVSLGAVLTLVWLLGRFARRRGMGSALAAESFTVLGRQPLSRTSSVALVRVGQTALVVGVAEGSVRLLSTAPLADVMGSDPVDLTALTPSPPSALALSPTPASRARDAGVEGPGPASSARDAGVWGPSTTAPAEEGRTRRRAVRPAQGPSALAGSALSPTTWTRAVDVLRERTTRR